MRRSSGALFAALLMGGFALFMLACGDDIMQPGGDVEGKPGLSIIPPVPGSDSLGFVLRWSASIPGPRQVAIDHYNTRLFDMVTDFLVYEGQTPGLVDTLWSSLPAWGDTVQARGCVQAVDTYGQGSSWTCSATLLFVLHPAPPNPVDSVYTDTLPGYVVRVDVRPGLVAMLVGEQRQFCAFATTSTGAVEILGDLDLAAQLVCMTELGLWRGSRSV